MARPYAINATALKTTHKAGGRGGESTARSVLLLINPF